MVRRSLRGAEASDVPHLKSLAPKTTEPSAQRFFEDERRAGTFAPFFRASLKPIAIACFRLLTVRPDPLLSVPRFRRRIADSTRVDADFPYLAICHLIQPECTDCSRDHASGGR